jgi:cysteine desulfurase/selenocysteine lyase
MPSLLQLLVAESRFESLTATLLSRSMPNWTQLRAEFPSLSGWTYLDTATFGQNPRCASQAVIRHFTHRDETASSQFLSWFDDMDRIRESCAKLVNCQAGDIAFVPNACTGLSFLMQGLDWKQGDEVLTLSDEFPNQLYQAAAALRFHFTFKKVAWQDFYASVNPERTRVVVLSSVNYASGFRPPIEEIGRFLKERGILFYLDGTQSVGALQIDVQAVRPALLCVDAYKWLLSPNGAGFVYVDPEWRPRLPPAVVGWRSDAGWREVGSLNHGTPVFPESAQKYEGGMIPFPSLYGMGAVLEMMLDLGPAAIESRVLELAAKTRAMLAGLADEVNSDASQIVTAKLPGRNAGELARVLRTRNIVISARHGRLRVSPHFYNDETDIETLRAALLE